MHRRVVSERLFALQIQQVMGKYGEPRSSNWSPSESDVLPLNYSPKALCIGGFCIRGRSLASGERSGRWWGTETQVDM